MVDGTVVAARGVCQVDVVARVNGLGVSITLCDVLLVPGAPYTLLSQTRHKTAVSQ
jgi:hypothetical protein